jgi:hypothetical protein
VSIREVPASVGQRVLWQMDHHRGGHGALNCPLLLRIEGPLDRDALQIAVDGLGKRHEALRTTFAGRGPRLRQLIHGRPLPLPIADVDLSAAAAPEAALQSAIASEVQTRTDTERQPVRVTLWRLAAERFVLCVNMHHLVTDGWSTAIVADDIGRLYARALARGPELAPVAWQYADWCSWHQRQLEGDNLRRLQAYWRRQLADARLPDLPRRDTDVPLLERRTAVHRAVLPHDVVGALQSFARARSTAFFTCLLAVYYALLQRETGDGDFAIGSIFANRSRREAQSTLGFLSNMVVLRTRVGMRTTFVELVAAAADVVVGAFAHQELPFQMLRLDTIDAASMRPDAIVFQLFAGPMAPAVIGDLRIEPIIDVPDGIGSRWEFELSLAPAQGGLAVLLCFAEDVYDARWARGFLDAYVSLAAAIARDPLAPLPAPALA